MREKSDASRCCCTRRTPAGAGTTAVRIHDDFIEWGEHVSRKRIIRLKQEEGLIARVRKRYKGTTDSDHDQPIADNLLRQDFTAQRPNQRWVGDTSELRIGEQGRA